MKESTFPEVCKYSKATITGERHVEAAAYDKKAYILNCIPAFLPTQPHLWQINRPEVEGNFLNLIKHFGEGGCYFIAKAGFEFLS